jgi:hypothetical protein
MSTFLGSDTDALRELAQLYDAQASALENSAVAVVQRAPSVSWVGPDAEEFRSSCHQVYAQLADVLDRIRRWADDLGAEADEQDAPSTADLTGSGTRGGGTGSDRSPLDILSRWCRFRVSIPRKNPACSCGGSGPRMPLP